VPVEARPVDVAVVDERAVVAGAAGPVAAENRLQVRSVPVSRRRLSGCSPGRDRGWGLGSGPKRHHHPVELGEREREDHEVRDVAQHEPDPRAATDPHRRELLRASVHAVQEAAP
jgi:hypothetical protein